MLKPPEKKSIFTEFDCSKATTWREKNVQHSWWNSNSDNPSIVSEWCLLREIIWTLELQPLDSDMSTETIKQFSKFFSVNLAEDEIVVNSSVSLTSATADDLQPILSEIASVSTKLYRFRKFFANVFHPPAVNNFLETVQMAPHSIQCYATGMRDFMRIISKAIIDLEIEFIEQDLSQTVTLIQLYNKLRSHFKTVHTLYDIHENVYIDFKTNAGKM